MFFKKLFKTNEDTLAEEGRQKQRPIYIIGSSPWALLIAARFKDNGDKVIILTTADARDKLSKNGVTIKEEYNLQKNKHTFTTDSLIKENPRLIILSAEAHNLRAHLSMLSSSRFPEAPIVCFNYLQHPEIIRPLLGFNYVQAYTQAFLSKDGDTITAHGYEPIITFSALHTTENPFPLLSVLRSLNFEIIFSETDRQNFWNHFGPYMLGYLATTNRIGLSDLLKDKTSRETLQTAALEVSDLAACDKCKLSAEETFKTLIEAPHNYSFKNAHRNLNGQTAELDVIYTLLSEYIRTYRCKVPTLNTMIKTNYNSLSPQ